MIALCKRASFRAERTEIRMQQRHRLLRERSWFTRDKARARAALLDLLADTAAIRGEHRRPARERLQRREPKRLIRTRRHNQIHRSQKISELLAVFFVRQKTHPRRAVGLRNEARAHRAVAH